jgi:hypothetical protein
MNRGTRRYAMELTRRKFFTAGGTAGVGGYSGLWGSI